MAKPPAADYTAGSYMDTGYTADELRDMLSGGDTSLSQTAEGAALSVQLLEEREKQLMKLLDLERLFKQQVRIVRRAEKAQDRIRFRIFSCQNRHEEAIEFGDLSDMSSSDSEGEDNEFGVMTIDEIQALLVKLNALHEETVSTAKTARDRLMNDVLPFLPETRFEKRLQGGRAWTPRVSPRAVAGASLPPAVFYGGTRSVLLAILLSTCSFLLLSNSHLELTCLLCGLAPCCSGQCCECAVPCLVPFRYCCNYLLLAACGLAACSLLLALAPCRLFHWPGLGIQTTG